MIRVAIDSGEGKKCAPPALFSDSLSAPIRSTLTCDFQQGCLPTSETLHSALCLKGEVHLQYVLAATRHAAACAAACC
jgi:hypothetical protein